MKSRRRLMTVPQFIETLKTIAHNYKWFNESNGIRAKAKNHKSTTGNGNYFCPVTAVLRSTRIKTGLNVGSVVGHNCFPCVQLQNEITSAADVPDKALGLLLLAAVGLKS